MSSGVISGQHGSEAIVVAGGEVIVAVVAAMIRSSQYVAGGDTRGAPLNRDFPNARAKRKSAWRFRG